MEKRGEFGSAIWICLAANGAIQLSFEDLLLLLRSRIFSSSLLIQHPEHDGLWTASQKSAGDSTFYMGRREERVELAGNFEAYAAQFCGHVLSLKHLSVQRLFRFNHGTAHRAHEV
jgi:hypothetical protein